MNFVYSVIVVVLVVGAMLVLAVATAYLPNRPSVPMPMSRHGTPAAAR